MPAAIGDSFESSPMLLGSDVDYRQMTAGQQRTSETGEHGGRIDEVMVDQAEQDCLATGLWEARVHLIASHDHDVGEPRLLDLPLDGPELVIGHFGCEDSAFLPNEVGNSKAPFAVTRPDVGHLHAQFDGQHCGDLVDFTRRGAVDLATDEQQSWNESCRPQDLDGVSHAAP